MLVVCDTSPVRALQALGWVAVLGQLYGEVLIPPAVADELSAAAGGIGTFSVGSYSFMRVVPPTDLDLVARLGADLGRGEAEALALAVEIHADLVLVDDRKARQGALRMGLRIAGVLAVLRDAKVRGIVPAVGPLLDRLQLLIGFRISPALREAV